MNLMSFDRDAAAAQMVRVRDQIVPDPAAHAAYRFYADQYIATYPRVQDLMQATTRYVARR